MQSFTFQIKFVHLYPKSYYEINCDVSNEFSNYFKNNSLFLTSNKTLKYYFLCNGLYWCALITESDDFCLRRGIVNQVNPSEHIECNNISKIILSTFRSFNNIINLNHDSNNIYVKNLVEDSSKAIENLGKDNGFNNTQELINFLQLDKIYSLI